MHTHILAFMEPKLFLVCGLIILLIFTIRYISNNHRRDLFYIFNKIVTVTLENKKTMYVCSDMDNPLTQDDQKKIKKTHRKIRKTGSRLATKEEVEIAITKDPDLAVKFTSIVFGANDRPNILLLRKAEREEQVGFAAIRERKI